MRRIRRDRPKHSFEADGVVLALVAMQLPKLRPPEEFFERSRCYTVTRHSTRTIEAWRSGKPKFCGRAKSGVPLNSNVRRRGHLMPPISGFLSFAIVAFPMALSPGPNLLYLASRSICQDRSAGFAFLGAVCSGIFL